MGKTGQNQWYEHVPKLLERVKKANQPYCGISKCKPTEASITTNRTT
jgi:hypothetical protein